MKLGHNGMLHAGPSFVPYALLLDPGCCPRAHFELDGQVESDKKKKLGRGTSLGSMPRPHPACRQTICMPHVQGLPDFMAYSSHPRRPSHMARLLASSPFIVIAALAVLGLTRFSPIVNCFTHPHTAPTTVTSHQPVSPAIQARPNVAVVPQKAEGMVGHRQGSGARVQERRVWLPRVRHSTSANVTKGFGMPYLESRWMACVGLAALVVVWRRKHSPLSRRYLRGDGRPLEGLHVCMAATHAEAGSVPKRADDRSRGFLDGKVVVFTGKFKGHGEYDKEELAHFAEAQGATVKGSLTKQTQVVVVGDDPTEKQVAKARELQVETWTVRDFMVVAREAGVLPTGNVSHFEEEEEEKGHLEGNSEEELEIEWETEATAVAAEEEDEDYNEEEDDDEYEEEYEDEEYEEGDYEQEGDNELEVEEEEEEEWDEEFEDEAEAAAQEAGENKEEKEEGVTGALIEEITFNYGRPATEEADEPYWEDPAADYPIPRDRKQSAAGDEDPWLAPAASTRSGRARRRIGP